jgi:uncharacterized membrane protein
MRSGITKRDWRTVLVCAFVFLLVYALLGLFRHWRFGTNYDMAIFDQAVWHLSRFEAPASTIRGFQNILGDHFHPIIAVWAPLYWMWPSAETLIVAQALLFAASTIPVFLFLRSRLAYGPSIALTVAYGFFWGLQRAVFADVHEIAFAPLLIATAILAIDQQRWTLLCASAVALGLVKEDLIPVVSFLGVLLLLRGHRATGLTFIAASAAAFLLVLRVVIPAFGPGFGYTGPYEDLLREPWSIPAALVTPPAKLMTVLLWVAPFVLLPLLSPIAVLLIPLALTRLLSDVPQHWGTTFHYSAPLAPILVMSAADALHRIAARITAPRLRARVVGGLAGTAVLFSIILPGNQPHWNLFKRGHYQIPAQHRAGHRMLQRIPPDASVVAQGAIAPHLTHRQQIFLLQPGVEAESDFVVAGRALALFPLSDGDELDRLLEERRAQGYTTLYEKDGWVLLRKR